MRKCRFPSLISLASWQPSPPRAWHGVVLLADAKAMKMKVRPVEADLQDDVKIGQGAVGSYEKAPPEHRVNPANRNVDNVSFGLRILFHYAAQPIRWSTPRLLPSPRFRNALVRVCDANI